jgi:phospholipid/cholesterol/gamma-HCH transport system substrate-binding protein
MFKHLEGARLGLFIFIGTVLLVFSIFFIGNKEKLFTRTIEIKAYFSQIEGLKVGAPVRLSGYDIGSVSGIAFAQNDSTAKIEVKMRIDESLKQFIRIDSEASVETEGLVGKKIITITPGSPNQAEIYQGTTIKSKSPVNVTKIIEQTESVMSNLNELTHNFSGIFAKINQGEGSLGRLVHDDQLYNSAVNITQTGAKSLTTITNRMNDVSDLIINTTSSVKTVVANVDSAIYDIRGLLYKIDKGQGALGQLIADKSIADSIKSIINNFVKTSEQTKSATSSLAENMEALKHNWLFKGYFEDRGYWNKENYEKELDSKLNELKKQQDLLDKKMEELKELEARLKK